MIHEYFEGTHGEIGFRCGTLLAKHGHFILEHPGFPLTPERQRFAQACLPIYQQYFPEVVKEIRGIADGQRCREQSLQALLFSMYAMPPACHCSCFAVHNENGIFLGRNSDFITGLEQNNRHVIYRLPSCSFSGNTTAFVQMEDGVNAHGLAVGLTSVYPHAAKPGMNAGLLLRFFLEKCRTTREVLRQIQSLPVASAQTFTVADSARETAVIECSCGAVQVLRPSAAHPYVCAVNRFHSAEMKRFNVPGIDDWQAGPRHRVLRRVLSQQALHMHVTNACDLLRQLCPYDRKTGRDTVWSTVYDLQARQIYRAEGNPCRESFGRDDRFSF